MILTITPYTLDEVQRLLEREVGEIKVYFPLYDGEPRTADCVAEIAWDKEKVEYTLGGHGIGSNRVQVSSRDALIDRIIADNDRFNNGNSFQVEATREETSH